MTLYYSIHPRRIWGKFMNQGYMEGNNEYGLYSEHYQWMMEQMSKRLPNYQGEYPVWLWTEIPEFYRFRFSDVARKKFVLLTIELDDKDVLLSDFEAWHVPLNSGSFDDDIILPRVYKYNRNVDMSDWEKIFDFDWLKTNFYENESEELCLQGTTGKIPVEKVVAVKYFTSKKLNLRI